MFFFFSAIVRADHASRTLRTCEVSNGRSVQRKTQTLKLN